MAWSIFCAVPAWPTKPVTMSEAREARLRDEVVQDWRQVRKEGREAGGPHQEEFEEDEDNEDEGDEVEDDRRIEDR